MKVGKVLGKVVSVPVKVAVGVGVLGFKFLAKEYGKMKGVEIDLNGLSRDELCDIASDESRSREERVVAAHKANKN